MPIDLAAAERFLTTHARQLDRRRYGVTFNGEVPDGALAALDGYRNPDGGYGWGLEPDLRDAGSQPGGAMHAFEVFAEVAPATTSRAAELCDWLAATALPDGGLPFALPVTVDAGTAPWWASTDPSQSSLHITAAVLAEAHRVARHDAAVAAHPWLERATRFCLDALAARQPGSAMELRFVLGFLDVAPDPGPVLERWVGALPPSGTLRVQGGTEEERLRPLDFAPRPGPVRDRIDAEAIAADLDRVEHGQEADGGWTVDHATQSPASALEWRGYATVHALTVLRDNGRLA